MAIFASEWGNVTGPWAHGRDRDRGTVGTMAGSPLEYVVHAEANAGELSHAQLGGDQLQWETRWEPEVSTGHPGPADLLTGSLAACLLKGIERSRALMPFSYCSVSVEVTGRRQAAPPRFVSFRYVIRLSTDESPEKVELLHRNLRHFGTIYNTLAAACDVDGEIIVVSE